MVVPVRVTVDLGAQSDLIGAPERMSIEAILPAPNGGSARAERRDGSSLNVIAACGRSFAG
jgi:hypothetical protein